MVSLKELQLAEAVSKRSEENVISWLKKRGIINEDERQVLTLELNSRSYDFD